MQRSYIFILSLLFAAPLGLAGQLPMATRVADILNEIPARDPSHRNRLAKEMLDMGASGLELLTAGVIEPGTGNDVRVRAALNGLVWYVGQEGQEDARLLVEKALLAALSRSSGTAVSSFFLQQLAYIGRSATVKALEPLLSSESLVDASVQTLVALHSPEAKTMLVQAYARSTGNRKLPVLRGIAAYADEGSLGILHAALEGETNPDIRKMALAGIARVGHPSSEKIMKAAAAIAGNRYEPSETMRSWITYLENLARGSHWTLAERNARAIIKENADTPARTYALAAMRLLITYGGMDGMDAVVTALSHPDAAYRGAALNLAAENGDVAGLRKILAKAPSLPAPAQQQVSEYLRKMHHPLAIPFLESQLKAWDAGNRQTALRALMAIRGKAGIPMLLDYTTRVQEEEIGTLTPILLSWISHREVPAVSAALRQAIGSGKVVLLGVLAERKATSAYQDVLGLIRSDNPVIALAAHRALNGTAPESALPLLLEKLGETRDEATLSALQSAIVSIASARNVALLREAWPVMPARQPALLGTFAGISDKSLLPLVASAFRDSRPEWKRAAFQALTQWKHEDAGPYLFPLITANDAETSKTAFRAFVRQVSTSSLSPERKVQALRKLSPFTFGDAGLKRLILQQLANLRLFPAFLAAASFLDDPEVKQVAAQSCTDIALPDPGGYAGLHGTVVRSALEKCMDLLTGSESDYTRENIRTWLRQMPEQAGFTSLFNGKDLSGWQGLVENPIARAAMAPAVRAARQLEADKRLPSNWTVADGEIQFTGTGYENLCTVRDFGDFELWVDWRITRDGDSGIYLRGSPQVQIWDTARTDAGAQVGSGGLYNNQVHPSKPIKLMDNAIGDWNTFFIRMVGEKVTVYLNGEKVVDGVTLENYWDRKLPIFPSGPIELQAHGTDLAFRDIYVRDLSANQIGLTPEEENGGFVSLFNGKDLSGWMGNKTDYKAVDGMIVIDPAGGGKGNLFTEKEYGDFIFRFEFQLTPGANNGIGVRAPLEGDAAYEGMEIQVLDNTSPIYANLQPYQYHGSVYGIAPAKREFLRPVGQWNEEEIRLEGDRIRVTLNGTVIVDEDLKELTRQGTIDKQEHPGLARKAGYIGFLGHGSVVHFRKIRVKSL